MRRMSCLLIALAAVAASLPAPGHTETPTWARMAEEDLVAARALLIESHPGAAAEVGDVTFQRQLDSGFRKALLMARAARTYGGYRAALQHFAAGFDDPHIATAPLVQSSRRWPGFAVALGTAGWTVIVRDEDDAPPVGATLLSCDGRTPDVLAEQRLAPIFGSWDVPAERIWRSTWLLQDVGNPHQPQIDQCEFSSGDGVRKAYELRWRTVSPAEIGRHLSAARPLPSEEVWVRQFEQGYWIRLGTSGGAAVPILAEAQRLEAALRAAPYVIVDLRGNAGGASFFTDEIARRIYGSARVAEARRPRGSGEPEMIVWRSSPSSLETVQAYIQRTRRLAPAEHPIARGLAAQRDALLKTLASGAPVARGPAEVGVTGAVAKPDPVGRPPRVILVTDGHCFSSCLLGVRLFRNLGAEHVGQATRANTRYSDLRTIDLPSGLSQFSTMQSFSTWLPMQIGPYAPASAYDGDLVDDAAVQAWVRRLLTSTG